tara:strand:- start:1321 stop:1638 length:318 start_codon:yes stop_codon:yes gene_type:complete
MMPISFAPMILKVIMPKIMDHMMKVFKLDKVLSYVENDNELDVAVADIINKTKIINEKIQHMQEIIVELDDASHPAVINLDEWKEVKETIKKIKNKKAFKSLNAK